MASNDEIKLIIAAETQKAVAELKKFAAESKKSGKEAEDAMKKTGDAIGDLGEKMAGMAPAGGGLLNIFNRLPGPLKAAGVGMVALVGGVVATHKAVGELVKQASAQDAAFNKLRAVAGSVGANFNEASEAAKKLASDGLMTIGESSSALSNLLASGIGLPQAIELLNRAKDAAVVGKQANYELGESVVVFTEGIKNQNSMNTDAVGISKNYAKVLEEQAKAQGKTVEQLTDQQKAQAAATGFIKEASVFTGQAAAQANTYAGAAARSASASLDLKVALGKLWQEGQTKDEQFLGGMLSGLTEFINKMRQARELKGLRANVAEGGSVDSSGRMKILEDDLAKARKKGDDAWRDSTKAAAAAEVSRIEAEIEKLKVDDKLSEMRAKGGEVLRKIFAESATEGVKVVKQIGEAMGALNNDAGAAFFTSTLVNDLTLTGKGVDIVAAAYDKLTKQKAADAQWAATAGAFGGEVRKAEASQIDTLIKKAYELGILRKNSADWELQNARQLIATDADQLAALQNIVEETEAQLKAEKDLAAARAEASKLKIVIPSGESGDVEKIKARIKALKDEEAERGKLLETAKDLGLVEKEITDITLAELKKRIKGYEQGREVLAAVLSGVGSMMGAAFDLAAAERTAALDQALADEDRAYRATLDGLNTRNTATEALAAMDKARRDAAQLEKDQGLAADKARLEAEIAATEDADEKKRLSAELAIVNKAIAEEEYQKKVEKLKADEAAQEKTLQDAKDAAALAHENNVKKLKKKSFEADKTAKIAQAISTGALAAINTFAVPGAFLNPAAWIAAGVGVGVTAANVATISAQTFPEYRVGSDYIPNDQIAKLHEGERVITREENKTYNQNMGGMTVNMYGVNDPEGLSRQIDDYIKRNGSILGVA